MAAAWRPPDLSTVEEFLQLFARAVRQFRMYPATSRLCLDAIAACQKARVSLDGRDQLTMRVTPRGLTVDDVAVGAGTIVEQDLAPRLHRARVAAVTVDRAASLRDFTRFCSDFTSVLDGGDSGSTLAELLADHGVDRIIASMAERPEVLDVGAPAAPLCDLVERERSRREESSAGSGPAIHLYPPDRGWVRVDPAAGIGAVSLVDLAILVDDPAEVAIMLLRLTGDEVTGPRSREAALERKFSDVTTLFTAMEPRLARLMFEKLARAVLDLQPERRKALLQRTILPGLLDGGVDGTVLKDFPDVDLAESLCLLLDLETAAPEVLSAALDRLDLPAERRQAMVPLLEAQLQARDATGPAGRVSGRDVSADRYARRLLQIDSAAGKSLAGFMAFDLSIDGQTSEAIGRVGDEIARTDHLIAELRCLSSLVRLEPNPGLVEKFLARSLQLFAELERASRWLDLASWVERHRRLEVALQSRPDVAMAISAALETFCTRERVTKMIGLCQSEAGRRAANALIGAFGGAVAPACVALLENPAAQATAPALVQLMCDHASVLAPELAARVDRSGTATARAAVRVMGFAGPGYEVPIARQLARDDGQTVREALRSLARIGTPEAAAIVAEQIRRESSWVRSAAEEALWRFPAAQVQAQVRALIGQRDFVVRNPDVAARLLDRATQARVDGFGQALEALAQLRFRFWNPALVRVARKARALLARG